MQPFFTSPSQSRACWSKNGECRNSEGLGSSESDSKKTGTITAPHLKGLFSLLSLAISKIPFFFYIFCPENDGVRHFGTSTFVIAPDKLARSLQIAFFLLINYVFIPIFYIGFKLQSSRRYWNIYQIFHIWDGLMLLNWTATTQKHKAGCKKINDTLKVDNLFFRIFLYFYHLFLNFRFAQLTPPIWENYRNIYPFVPIEIILDKKA